MSPYRTKPANLPATETDARLQETSAFADRRIREGTSRPALLSPAANESRDVVVVDMRRDTHLRNFGSAEGSLLRALNEEVMDALERMPLERDVNLCVRTSSCLVLSDWRSCMRVSGPLEVLEDVQLQLEAA
jgi:hypothetical protein